MRALRERGFDVSDEVFTVEKGTEAILKAVSKIEEREKFKMIKDITIGQYIPGESFIHKLDPRTKILISIFIYNKLIYCR